MSPLAPVVLATAAAWLAMSPPHRNPRRRNRTSPVSAGAPDWLLPVSAALGAGAAAALFVGGSRGVLLGLAAAVATGAWVRRLETPAARRRRERLEADLPAAVDLLAACLTAGRAPGEALPEVAAALDGPLHSELSLVAARLRLGTDPVAVWQEVAAHPQLGRLGRGLARVAETGSSVADATSRLAEDLRRDARARVEARARAVGVKAALPLGVCLLPAFVLVGVVPLVVGSLGALL
jgi:Flp pilus assembly protein TadB